MEKTIVIKITEEDFEITSTLEDPAMINLWLDIAKNRVLKDMVND